MVEATPFRPGYRAFAALVRVLAAAGDERSAVTEPLRGDAAAAELREETLQPIVAGLIPRPGSWSGRDSSAAATARPADALPHIETPEASKYLIWSQDEVGWGWTSRVGLVERYLHRQNVSRAEFAPRLALRCLQTLQPGVSPLTPDQADYREPVLGLLTEALGAPS